MLLTISTTHSPATDVGYMVSTNGGLLDDQFPAWGESPYVQVEIAGNVRLQDLLTHLYVLIPVLDNEKNYWVGEDEIEKVLKRGEVARSTPGA